MKLAFLDLPDDRVDTIPRARQADDVEVVLVAHADPEALALRIAEMLQVPRSTEPLDLLNLKPDLVALPSMDTASAAMLLKAGFSPKLFVTLDDLDARLGEPRLADATGDPTPIEEWEAHFERATGTKLLQLRDAFALTDDRQRLFREVLSLAVEQTGADAGSIMLVDEEAGELRIAFADGLSSDVVRTMRQRLGEGIAGRVAKEGKAMLVHDRVEDPRFKEGRERSRITAAMSAPIKLDGRIIGVLNVSSSQAGRRFHDKDLARLVEIGGQISGILERVVERTKRDLQASELRARHAIEEAYASAPADLSSRYRAVAHGLAAPLEASSITLYVADSQSRRFSVVSSLLPQGPEGSLPVAASGVLAAVQRDGEPVFLATQFGRVTTPNLVAVPIGNAPRLGVLVAEGVNVAGEDVEPFVRLLARLATLFGRLAESHRAEDAVARQSVIFGKLADVAPRLMMSRDVEFLATEAAGALRSLHPRCYVAARLTGREGASIERSAFDGAERDRVESAEREYLLAGSVLSDGAERVSLGGGSEEPAHMIVPIRLGERVLGTLGVVASDGNGSEAFGSSLDGIDLEALRKISLYVSLAWEQTTLAAGDLRPAQDSITGLLGTPGFETRVQDEVKRAERYHDRFLLTLCTLTEFEGLESKYGAEWAKRLLREFGEALSSNVREVDAVARLGGARFAVLSPETDKDSGALLRRLDHLVPKLPCVKTLRNPDEVRLVGRQFTYPDEVSSGGELLEILRREAAF